MTWKQFRILAIWVNILIIGGLWAYGFITDNLPPTQNLGRVIFVSFLAIFVITASLFVLGHIALFTRSKWRGDLPPFTRHEKMMFYAFLMLAIIWLSSFMAMGMAEPNQSNEMSMLIWTIGLFSFWPGLVLGLVIIPTIFSELARFKAFSARV